MHNLNLAFEVAEKHLDIPKMLDAEGILTNTFNICLFISVHKLFNCIFFKLYDIFRFKYRLRNIFLGRIKGMGPISCPHCSHGFVVPAP